MFAYCGNNTVNFIDYSGSIPKEINPLFNMSLYGASGFGSAGGPYIPVSYGNISLDNTDELSYKRSETNNGAQIENSYKVTNPYNMYKYITMNRKDEISGTTVGVVYEWLVHNIAYRTGEAAVLLGFDETGKFLMDRGKTLDVGSTIYEDSHGGLSQVMWISYGVFFPHAAAYDLLIKAFK